MMADGDKVIIRSTMTGTHKGSFMNMPASGKQFKVEGIDIVRIKNGRAVDHWGVTDIMTMMQQLGVVPRM
jgi:predicted ester cyclase